MRGSRQTIRHNDAIRGMNARPGVFSDGGEGLSEAVNVFADADDTIQLRTPLRTIATSFTAGTDGIQGLFRINGVWYTITKHGATGYGTPTIDGDPVTVLFFDAPPSTTAWTIKSWAVLDDTLCVWIEHDRLSSAVPKLLALHVFDDFIGQPTYVLDPAMPQHFHPELPQQFAGPATIPVYRALSPIVCNGHGKLWAARNDGNVQFCGIGRPRVWAPRDATSLEVDGVTYYHNAPSGGAVFSFKVPEILTDLTDATKVAAYKVQKFSATAGTWSDLAVVGGVPVAGQFRVTASTWRAGNCVQVEVGPETDGTLVRFLVTIVVNPASSWYIARHQLNLDYWAADGEADFLYTAGQESNGETITALSVVRSRLFVGYPSSSSLWQVGALADEAAFLDSYQYGALSPPTLVGAMLIISSQQGPRGVALDGLNYQGLVDRNIGVTLPISAGLRINSGVFWPWNGLTVFRATGDWESYATESHLPSPSVLRTETGTTEKVLVFQWSEEREIRAWFWWDLALGTVTSDFIPVDGRLYFRVGNNVHYFDAVGGVAQGDQTTPGGDSTAFGGYLSWHFRRTPPRARLVGAAIDGSGVWTLQTSTTPWAEIPDMDASAQLDGQTPDRTRAALTGTGQSYAVTLSGSSVDSPTLNAVDIDIIPLGR